MTGKNEETATIEELHADVQARRAELEDAIERERDAGREATAARKRFNEAARRFDDKVAEIRSGAPWDTDWSRGGRPMIADRATAG